MDSALRLEKTIRMKKNYLTIGAVCITICLAAYGIISATSTPKKQAPKKRACSTQTEGKTNNDFLFVIEPRFVTRVTPEQINTAQSAKDLLPDHEVNSIHSYENFAVTQYEMGRLQLKENSPMSRSGELTENQKSLLQSLNCTNSFFISGKVQRMKKDSDELYFDTLIYYISVTPETEAVYENGNEALIEYLRNETKEDVAKVDSDRLQPGKIHFIVTKNGTIKNIEITHTCGYRKIDSRLLKLVNEMPGSWTPGTDSDGNAVDQELVFFFGLKGC